MIWNDCCNSLKISISLFIVFLTGGLHANTYAQVSFVEKDFILLELRTSQYDLYSNLEEWTGNEKDYEDQQEESAREEYPEPRSVMFRSMMVPGWGQVTNRQIWKVPIIYGLFAGVGYYNYTLTEQYHGYRAAFYNQDRAERGEESDFRFGPTPDFIPEGVSTQELRRTRDNLRNRRDFSYVIMFLAYGLNVLDAYVYAHMRSFDVSDDLSANTTISPGILEGGTPGVNVRITFTRKGN